MWKRKVGELEQRNADLRSMIASKDATIAYLSMGIEQLAEQRERCLQQAIDAEIEGIGSDAKESESDDS
jgi:hypothetical protein